MWYIGQRIVCVDDKSRTGRAVAVIKDEIYIINSISTCRCGRLKFNLSGSFRYDLHYSVCLCGVEHSEQLNCPSRFSPLLEDSQEYADKLIKELETEINEEILITV